MLSKANASYSEHLVLSFTVRVRSDLVPEHGARERFLMGTNVSTPLFQEPTPEFGH